MREQEERIMKESASLRQRNATAALLLLRLLVHVVRDRYANLSTEIL